jgi:hypothetical protein
VSITRYRQSAYPWVTGNPLVDLGEDAPRTNLEVQGKAVKPWPSAYRWSLMGLGAMPLFQLGATQPVFNNQLAPYAPGFNMQTPGLAKKPFG